MSSHIVAVIRAYDVTWTTPCKIKLSKKSPSQEEQAEFIKESLEELERDVAKAKEDWHNFPLRVCTDEMIRSKIRTTGTNFIDFDFPPCDKSIFDPSRGQAFDRLVHWRRPRDFMIADPKKGLFEP